MLRNDIRYALRLMWRNPGFTVVAVISMALGIGANTAIFSLFYTVMLRQLPVPHPGELVELVRNSPLRTVAAGLALGIPMVLWIRPLAGLLVEDLRITAAPLVLGAAAIVFLAVVASYLPARRAAQVDPIEALRHE